MLFPLITFPYASRILQADGIGLVNFYNSIISYISLITCLGIPLYATREVAKVKEEPEKLSQVSLEILWLHIILTCAGYLLVAILCFFVPKIKENYLIFLILSSSILFTTMGCEWFFRGREDFKYITIRGLIIRIIYLPLLFCFVRDKSDLIMYSILTVLVSVGNNAFNFYRMSNIIPLFRIRHVIKRPHKHIKGALKIFALSASISIYTQLSIVFLGFLASSINVGYYVGASRIIQVLAGLITALQTTLLPRLSNLIAKKDFSQADSTIDKVINFIFCLAIPLSCGIFVMAEPIVILFCGDSYIPAITTLKILSPVLFFIALSGVISGGILLPKGKENIATISCIVAACINIIINLALIPILLQNGTAIASIATEFTVVTAMLILGKNYINFSFFKISYIKYILAGLTMMGICLYLKPYFANMFITCFAIPLIGCISYLFILILLKDKFVLSFIKNLISKS